MGTRTHILKLLADGDFHSGTDIGQRLGISRAAVWKGIKTLCALGLDIHRVSGRGYKLAVPVAPLDADAVQAVLAEQGARLPGTLTLLEEVDSTNRYLLKQAATLMSGSACFAEIQRQGRGRRGRSWHATPYRNLMLSFAWRFDAGPSLVAGLSLAAGLAVLRALEDYGVPDLGLKWPNDVLARGRKIAGLLADVQGEAAGPCLVILGIGINTHLESAEAGYIDQPWIDVRTLLERPVDRNRIAGLVLAQLVRACELYAHSGFAAFREDWQRRHIYHQQSVRLVLAHEVRPGVVDGVDDAGGLWLREADGTRRLFHSGEISLRPVA